MYVDGTSPRNRQIPEPVPNPERNTAPASILCGDEFVRENGIDQINYLKIDTEGFDLGVMVGFAAMLRSHKIDMVQFETGLHPGNPGHVPFERAKYFHEAFDYCLFHIVDQTFETRNRGHLRRCDAVFVSKTCVQENM